MASKSSLARAFGVAALAGLSLYGGGALLSNAFSAMNDVNGFTTHLVFLSRVNETGYVPYGPAHKCFGDEIAARITGPMLADHFLKPKSLLDGWQATDPWIGREVIPAAADACRTKGHDTRSIIANLGRHRP